MSIHGNGVDPNEFDDDDAPGVVAPVDPLAALFPGSPEAVKLQAQTDARVERAGKLIERSVRYGWRWVEARSFAKHATDGQWGGTARRYLMMAPGEDNPPVHRSGEYLVFLIPEWLSVLATALIPKLGKSRASAGFFEMMVSWCAAGGVDALEGRAKPAASIAMLAKDPRALQRDLNQFMNDLGF